MDVFVSEDGERRPLEFAPDYEAVASATLRLPAAFALDYTATLTGPMKLPEYDAPFERAAVSPVFSVHNVRLSRDFHVHGGRAPYQIQAFVAVENVFDYTQPTPLVDPGNPFGDRFDTAYVYGPIRGREFGLGFRLTLAQ